MVTFSTKQKIPEVCKYGQPYKERELKPCLISRRHKNVTKNCTSRNGMFRKTNKEEECSKH